MVLHRSNGRVGKLSNLCITYLRRSVGECAWLLGPATYESCDDCCSSQVLRHPATLRSHSRDRGFSVSNPHSTTGGCDLWHLLNVLAFRTFFICIGTSTIPLLLNYSFLTSLFLAAPTATCPRDVVADLPGGCEVQVLCWIQGAALTCA